MKYTNHLMFQNRKFLNNIYMKGFYVISQGAMNRTRRSSNQLIYCLVAGRVLKKTGSVESSLCLKSC